MEKITIVGLGQMARYYANAIKAFGYGEENIIGVDVNPDKIAAFKSAYPLAEVSLHYPEVAPVAIVATNTPSHHTVIEHLARMCETRWIFCEKPLGIDTAAVEDIQEVVDKYKVKVFTAFLIGFSPAVTALVNKMLDENLVLVDGSSTWGKNRIGDSRPSPGNLMDESVHGVKVLLDLAHINQKVLSKAVMARLSFPSFVDPEAQKLAQKFDKSFPLDPNGTTKCLIDFNTDIWAFTCLTESSFVRGDQVREVTATLAHKEAPHIPLIHAKLAFDIKGEGGVEDHLTLFELHDKKKDIQSIKASCNKIQEELRSFFKVVEGEEPDSRLTDLREAKSMASFAASALQSHHESKLLTFQ